MQAKKDQRGSTYVFMSYPLSLLGKNSGVALWGRGTYTPVGN